MPILKTLSFTTAIKTTNDPVQTRRARFVLKLEEQKALCLDPNFVRSTHRWTEVDGQRQATVSQQRVRPWWRIDASGHVVMSIMFGSKPVEFEKGKAGIAVPSTDKLAGVIDTLISAVRAGELDDILSSAAKSGTIGKPRKAA